MRRTGERAKRYGLVLYELISWALVALCLLMIFQFSAQDASSSSALSAEVTDVVVRIGDREAPAIDRESEAYRSLHALVRKLAHAGEYCALSLSLILALAPLGRRRARSKAAASDSKGKMRWAIRYQLHRMGCVLLICMAVACLDEWSQSLSLGRGPGILDVLIDSSGALVGCAAVQLLRWLFLCVIRSEGLDDS